MNYENLPSTIIYEIFNNYLNCHDQLKFTYVFNNKLYINERMMSTILRSSPEIDLRQLFRRITQNTSHYLERKDRIYLRNTSMSWPYILPRSFDVNTLNKLWAYYHTDVFSLYCRLFSYTPFVYQPSRTLIDVFDVPCKIFCFGYLLRYIISFLSKKIVCRILLLTVTIMLYFILSLILNIA